MTRLQRMHALVLVLAVGSLAGCSTVSTVKLDIPAPTDTPFNYVDQRPHSFRDSKARADAEGSSNLYFADDNLEPRPAELLRRTLASRLGNALKGRDVVLLDFDAHVTEFGPMPADRRSVEAASRAIPPGKPGAAANAALAAPMANLAAALRPPMKVVVEVRMLIDGQELVVFQHDELRGGVSEDNVRRVIDDALTALVKRVDRVISP